MRLVAPALALQQSFSEPSRTTATSPTGGRATPTGGATANASNPYVASYNLTCGSAKMALTCTLDVVLEEALFSLTGGADVKLAVRYHPARDNSTALWSSAAYAAA